MDEATQRRIKSNLKQQFLNLVNDSRRVETANDGVRDIVRFRYDRGFIADHLVDTAWETVAKPFLSESRSVRGDFVSVDYRQPAPMQMVLVRIGNLSFIGEMHPDCGHDWFMLDGTRVNGEESWWMPIPQLPA